MVFLVWEMISCIISLKIESISSAIHICICSRFPCYCMSAFVKELVDVNLHSICSYKASDLLNLLSVMSSFLLMMHRCSL